MNNELSITIERLSDKIEVMNEFPQGKNDFQRLGYLMAVNEMAQFLLKLKIEFLKMEGISDGDES